MSQDLRSSNKYLVYLIGNVNHQITGTKLPSNRQVLAVLFYNIRQGKLTVQESANLTIKECMIFWEKARIPTKISRNSVEKLVKLYEVWKNLQKNSKKTTQVLKDKKNVFVNTLDNLFDIAHADALKLMKIDEDKNFLQRQREPGRPGSLIGVDYNLWRREERTKSRLLAETNRRLKENKTTTISPNSSFSSASSSSSINSIQNKQFHSPQVMEENVLPLIKKGRKEFLSPKLVAALDRCQLSMRDSVYILEAALEALGHNVDEYIINKSSMQRIRTQMRKERAEKIKADFKNNIPEMVTIHWDGKLLPAINAQKVKEERLPIVITYANEEKLIAVPKLDHASGKEQAAALLNAINDWQISEKVQIMCCDTTPSNTGRFNGTCALLEQALERELLLFGCRHHVYELVLKTVFETKIPQVTVSADVPLFKKLKKNWNSINHNNFQNGTSISSQHFQPSRIDNLISFYLSELKKPIVRGDYRELIELSILFLNGNYKDKFKIKPPGAMHQARWMARAIYTIKMFLFRDQLNLSRKEIEGLQEVSLFIATTYVKPWIQCNLAVKAPYQDLSFIKAVKCYEIVDNLIAEAVLKKFCQHLYYLTEEIVILSLFDDMVDIDTKKNIVANLTKESKCVNSKRYVPSEEEMRCTLFDKKLNDFVSIKSNNMFLRLKINNDFLTEDPSTWEDSVSFLEAKSKVAHLKAVNDSAERAVNLTQQFHGLLTVQEEQKQYILQCVQEHRKIYPNCTKTTLKQQYAEQ